MTSLFALRALLFAGELLAGSTAIMAAAWLLAPDRTASSRHLAWAGAFGAVLALPLLVAVLPSPLRILLPAPPQDLPLQMLNQAAIAASLPAPSNGGLSLDAASLAVVLGCLWLAGLFVIVLRYGAAAFCLAALKRRSRPFALAPGDLPKIAATRRECELRLSDCETGPITWGVFRPVILLPKTAVFWPRERMNAVLLHELAHIRRGDSVAQALSLIVCAVYWPNPLVWIAARRLRREAEIAADDAAIVSGFKPSRYAGELLQLAGEFRTRRPSFSALSLFMAERSALEARVESVLAPTTLRTGVTARDVTKIAGVAFCSAIAIAFACPSLAQESRPAPVHAFAAASDVPPAPEVPAPPAPPAPPMPRMPPMPPAPPAPPAAVTAPSVAPPFAVSDSRRLSRLNRKCLHAAIERAKREARAAIERARPEIENAVVQAETGDDALRAVRQAQPEIDAAVARATREAREAMARATPEMHQAMVEAKARETAMRALREAQPQIDAALAQASQDLVKAHIDSTIQERVQAMLKHAEVRIEAAQARVNETVRDEPGQVSSTAE